MSVGTEISNEHCSCGRALNRPHCPNCGRAKIYAYSAKKAQRAHPQTGVFSTDIKMYRCEVCGKEFDDYQWQYECKAPAPIFKLHEQQKKITKDTWVTRANNHEKFDENMKRAFQKAVGISYSQHMELMRNLEQNIIKRNIKKLGETGPVVIHSGSAAKPATPYDAHLEQCQTCMIADDREHHCEAGKILFDIKNGVRS